MGGQLCCPYRNDASYSVRRKQDKQGIGHKTSTVTPTNEAFDSIKKKTLDPCPKKDVVSYETSNTTVSPNGTIYGSATTDTEIRISQISQASAIPGFADHDCDTISDVSSHSDLGSEYTGSTPNANGSATLKTDSDTTVSGSHRDDIKTFTPPGSTSDSVERGFLNANNGYGRQTSHAPERQYTCSRLGNRHILVNDLVSKQEEVIQWKKGNKLGSGTYGTVFLGLTNTGGLIAVKQITLTSDLAEAEKEYEKIYKEVRILKALDHENIVSYLGSNYDDNIINIFMQYVPGGSLYNIIQKFGALDETITQCYTQQLLDAVVYLHENNVVHRDIKSANIMLMPEGYIKLIDFGCATKLCLRLSQSGSHLQKSMRGTPYWMAPEVINESGHGTKSDIWSAGCTVFEMLTGKPPWGEREPLAAIFAIGSEDIPIPNLPESFSIHAREFVRLALLRDKYKRPRASKLKSHPFLTRPLPPKSPKVQTNPFRYSKNKQLKRKDTF